MASPTCDMASATISGSEGGIGAIPIAEVGLACREMSSLISPRQA